MNRQLEILQQLAEKGDAWAQEQLAKFDSGELPVQSQKHSEPIYIQHLKKQAEQDDTQAQFELGWEYANGEKRFRNYKTAVKWFRKAAERGHTPAQRELGCMYYDGEGVAQNFEKAVYWWEKAAEDGDSQAMANLGYYYLDNAPEAPVYASAVKWWESAAEYGDDIAAYNLHIFYHEQEDRDKEYKWLLRSAELGHAQAQYMVYLESKGVEIYWLLRAAEQGFWEAIESVRKTLKDENGEILVDLKTPGAIQFLLGELHEEGYCGLEANMTEAVKWYQRAETRNACLKLGICYEQGRGVDQDSLEAHKWYAWSRTPEGFCRMGCLEQEGLIGYQDMKAAAKHYRKASNAGNAHGSYRLAVCYVHGWGVSINFDEAERRFRMAETQGFIVQ